jgi:hypothetical protein
LYSGCGSFEVLFPNVTDGHNFHVLAVGMVMDAGHMRAESSIAAADLSD